MTTAGADAARTQALRLLEGDAAGAEAHVEPLALAWALKDLCYEAWNAAPARAARAADALAALAQSCAGAADAAEIRALAAWTAGIAEVTRGHLAEALPLFDAACAGLRAAGKPDPAAQTQVPKLMVLSMLGRGAEAAEVGAAAQRELRELGNIRAAARVSLNLGNLLMLQDAYASAAGHFREAAVLFARQGEHVQSVLADIGWAVTLCWQGHFDEAERAYARARMRAANRGLERQLALVDELSALLALARGRYREALAGYESARRRYEALAVPQDLAVAEKQLADVYLELHLLPEALALLQAALARFGALGLVVQQARAQAQLGRALALLGRPEEAAEAFAAAAAAFEGQHNLAGRAQVALARAELAAAAGDPAASLQHAAEAAAAFGSAGQADGLARAELQRAEALLATGRAGQAAADFGALLDAARSRGQRQLQVRCRAGLGLAALAQERPAEAVHELEAAIELFEEQRRALPADEMRSAFLADHLRPYQARLRIALAEGRPADVLQQLDRFRARALDERLAEGAGPELGDEVRALRTRVDWLTRRRQQQLDEGGTPASAGLDAELRRAEDELLEQVRRQRFTATPGGAATPAAPAETFGIDALRLALGEGDAIVEYGLQDDELFACVVTPGGVLLCRAVASWLQVLEAVRALRFQLDALRHGAAPVARHLGTLQARCEARLERLHALLWAPLEPALAGARRVLVVPHGVLAELPFAALMHEGRPLGQRIELALAPSARAALRGLRQGAARPRRALALGETSRLAHAGREAHFVAFLFEQGRALVGEEATLAALQREASGADVLHLACHAQFRSDNPRFSALHLHDAALTVDLAEALPLAKGCTVVLSACESGLAEASSGDEMLGLARAFLIAGAARVVATLWPVDDHVTAGFMSRFYGALALGDGPAAALREAQAATRRENPHPHFWGAFSVHGGW